MRLRCCNDVLNISLRPVGENFARIRAGDFAVKILGDDLKLNALGISVIASIVRGTAMLRSYRNG